MTFSPELIDDLVLHVLSQPKEKQFQIAAALYKAYHNDPEYLAQCEMNRVEAALINVENQPSL